MKKRNKQFLKEKEFNRLKKRLDEITTAQHNLGWVELEIPQFIGYIAKLEPRQDIQNRDDAWVFHGICETFGTTCYAKKIEWFDFNRSKRDRFFKTYTIPHIHSINQSTYDSLVPQAKKYFTADIFSNNWRGTTYHCTVPNFYWEIVYEKDYRTKVKVSDVLLEQEEAEIESKINSDFYWESKWCKGAPKHFRKKLNRSQRAKSKSTLHKIWKKDYDIEFEDNYRSARWLWW